MGQLFESLITKQISMGIMKEEERELYRYGYVILCEWGFNLGIAIIIGVLTGSVQTTIIFLLSVMPLRSFAGGYHAKSPVSCAFISNAALLLVIGLSEGLSILPLSTAVILIPEVIIFGYISGHVPVDSPGKPLSDRECYIYGICAKACYLVELIIAAGLLLMGRQKQGIVIILVHIFVTVSLWAGNIQNNRLKKKESKPETK